MKAVSNPALASKIERAKKKRRKASSLYKLKGLVLLFYLLRFGRS
ncbi:hypothetical protein BSAF29S_04277 [Bacillus safensis subsp. safensis]